jgi:hypothetical protein
MFVRFVPAYHLGLPLLQKMLETLVEISEDWTYNSQLLRQLIADYTQREREQIYVTGPCRWRTEEQQSDSFFAEQCLVFDEKISRNNTACAMADKHNVLIVQYRYVSLSAGTFQAC